MVKGDNKVKKDVSGANFGKSRGGNIIIREWKYGFRTNIHIEPCNERIRSSLTVRRTELFTRQNKAASSDITRLPRINTKRDRPLGLNLPRK